MPWNKDDLQSGEDIRSGTGKQVWGGHVGTYFPLAPDHSKPVGKLHRLHCASKPIFQTERQWDVIKTQVLEEIRGGLLELLSLPLNCDHIIIEISDHNPSSPHPLFLAHCLIEQCELRGS